jgi:hypothetical protein
VVCFVSALVTLSLGRPLWRDTARFTRSASRPPGRVVAVGRRHREKRVGRRHHEQLLESIVHFASGGGTRR